MNYKISKAKFKNKLLYSIIVGLPIILGPIFVSCKNEDNNKLANGNQYKRLDDSQLATIHNQFVFELTPEANKEYNSNANITLFKFGNVINKLNKKYNSGHYDDGDKIANDPEFKKYFNFYKPDISKISKVHRIDIKFGFDNSTKLVNLYYDVICFDLRINEKTNEKISLDLGE
ncbi:hypothetical protein [Metamycoplasma canadense]|uniref:Lipoprotein n=1 Tax=Metamycoplasma canadense TaxID=29554 RepID=A0A077L6H9_9BACT|nr:hypothetical protein [Metamycoplasma canadense]BAP39421.1 hypothetical protein MCAN360_0170 [Metamycoplasma canadense]